MYRLLAAYPDDAVARMLESFEPSTPTSAAREEKALDALRAWSATSARADERIPEAVFEFLKRTNVSGTAISLPGPTGESNTYMLSPRRRVLCIAGTEGDWLVQLAAVVALNSRAVCEKSAAIRDVLVRLPRVVRDRVELIDDWTAGCAEFDAVLYHGDAAGLQSVMKKLADRRGPIVSVHAYAASDFKVRLERLQIERVISVNTAAAGGNASLMTIG